jgi:hypothetical protein
MLPNLKRKYLNKSSVPLNTPPTSVSIWTMCTFEPVVTADSTLDTVAVSDECPGAKVEKRP